ncbi:MAG: hypothetical protein AUI36_36870 [Cyanobacteria bacterium 13_1_40CM_2_61_4]|nr:MAG: hypothetical protein AUI36_36870 [Cyanobacteria bacterium 13_1_40CM_2_61_4]
MVNKQPRWCAELKDQNAFKLSLLRARRRNGTRPVRKLVELGCQRFFGQIFEIRLAMTPAFDGPRVRS